MDSEFSHDVRPMPVHRVRADAQVVRDNRIGLTPCDAKQDLTFTPRQRSTRLHVVADKAFDSRIDDPLPFTDRDEGTHPIGGVARLQEDPFDSAFIEMTEDPVRPDTGKDSDASRGAPPAHLLNDFYTRRHRHGEIKDEKVGLGLLGHCHSRQSVCSLTDDVQPRLGLEHLNKALANDHVVVGNDHRKGCSSAHDGSMLDKLIALASLFCTLFFFLANHASAGAPPVVIEDNRPTGSINQHVDYLLEDDRSLDLDDVIFDGELFQRSTLIEPDFEYRKESIWLRIPVENRTDAPRERFLVMHTNFMRVLQVWWVDGSGASILLDQNPKSTFKERVVPYHQLVAPVVLPPKAGGHFYIRYSSEGTTALPISLETPLSFAVKTNRRMMIDFGFYGIMVMFVVASVLGWFIWRTPIFSVYALYALAVLLYIFHRDGYAFQYLWPDAPWWNNAASLPIGASLPIFAALFTRVYLDTKRLHPVIDAILLVIVVVQVAVVLSAFPFGGSFAKKTAVLTVTMSVLTFFCIGIIAVVRYGRRSVFFVIGWFGLLCASLIMAGAHWFNVEITRGVSLDTMRGAMVFDALMLGLACVFGILDLQRERDRMNTKHIAALDLNLHLHRRLSHLEQKYHVASTLAEARSKTLFDTTHDLRQPLYALRASIGQLSAEQPNERQLGDLRQSLDYIETLVETVLDEAIEHDEAAPSIPHREQDAGVPASKVFQSLQLMFEADAEEGKIDLRIVPSEVILATQAIPVLRIMTNFLSNALRYGQGGDVLVGLRRRGDHITLEVYDRGPGMTSDTLNKIKARGVRGVEEGSGHGLGLSIVEEIAAEHGWSWDLRSTEGRGTVASVTLPRAPGEPRDEPKAEAQKRPAPEVAT